LVELPLHMVTEAPTAGDALELAFALVVPVPPSAGNALAKGTETIVVEIV